MIDYGHEDITLEKIQFIWIADIGDLRFTKEEIEKVCTDNTIIILSGYSKKKAKKYNEDNIKILTSLAPVYFVWGPQDYKGNYRDLNALLLDCKVTILENTNAKFETENGTKFSLIGLDDVDSIRYNLEYALEDLEDQHLNILISFKEVRESLSTKYENIQVYLFGNSQVSSKRNDRTIYLELNSKSGFLKRSFISVINFNVKQK
ncbi:hypothetical protein [Bacillus sp. EAC]|uniref:hypothetical protein n=1 Tax=Bacillus sp. EAC TaxID=1978338 RepID=UPI000B430570|nr:hypothetical protein [Bacillus sp. EAC]